MRTICRFGPHIERKRDIIANDWVPRPSGPGFDRIPAPLCAVARWVPHPPRRAVGETESGIPRVAPSSFWVEGDRMAAVSDHVLLLPPSPFGRGAGGEGMSRNLKNNQSNPFVHNRKEDTAIHQDPPQSTPPFGPVEKPMETVAAGLDSDEVGIVTCRQSMIYECLHSARSIVLSDLWTFSTCPSGWVPMTIPTSPDRLQRNPTDRKRRPITGLE